MLTLTSRLLSAQKGHKHKTAFLFRSKSSALRKEQMPADTRHLQEKIYCNALYNYRMLIGMKTLFVSVVINGDFCVLVKSNMCFFDIFARIDAMSV